MVENRAADLERDYRPMSRRYFGAELGDEFANTSWSEDFRVVVMRPERWLSANYERAGLT